MQAHARKTSSTSLITGVLDKHVNRTVRTNPAGEVVRWIVTAALLGGLVVGSIVTTKYANAAGHANAQHQTAVGSISNVPWMY